MIFITTCIFGLGAAKISTVNGYGADGFWFYVFMLTGAYIGLAIGKYLSE